MPIIEKFYQEDTIIVRFEVEEEQHLLRLDQLALLYYSSFSREQIKQKIVSKEISIEKRPGKQRPSSRVHHKDIVKLVTKKSHHEDEYWNGEKIIFQETPETVYEDDELIIISKPPFMTTHPTGRHLFYCATTFFEKKYNQTIHSIHRLDRETSGLLLLGKKPTCASQFMEYFEKNLIRKCYFFIAEKRDEYLGKSSFKATQRMGPIEETGLRRVEMTDYPKSSSSGKSAETDFIVLHEENNYVLALAFPKTGRQHQIRLHAKIHGLPLIGDKIYYQDYQLFQRFKDHLASNEDHEKMQIPRHALHAVALNIPFKGARKTFEAPIPHDLASWIQEKLSIDLKEVEKLIHIHASDYFQGLES